ncbi:MAG: DinB family protein, partial [Dehalococcoidia bacterium]|nr:DinB family protein [Dehalococcoidia bacterium]
PESHGIGFTLWHIYRVEDFWFQRFVQSQAELYESEGWREKLGTPPKDMGYQYTVEQIAGFQPPPLETIQEYGKSVRQHTLEFLRQLP